MVDGEQSRERRQRVLKGAAIISGITNSEISCTIRNQTSGGAELKVSGGSPCSRAVCALRANGWRRLPSRPAMAQERADRRSVHRNVTQAASSLWMTRASAQLDRKRRLSEQYRIVPRVALDASGLKA